MRKLLIAGYLFIALAVVFSYTVDLPEQIFVSQGKLISVLGENVIEDSEICAVNVQIPSVNGLRDRPFEQFLNSTIEGEISQYRS